MAAMIRFEDVDFRFTGRGATQPLVLERLSFEIERGEFFCLLGPSGCGKTTVLNLLAGFEQPSSGRILVADRPVAAPGVERTVVFQGDDSLYTWLTAVENVEFGLRLAGLDAATRRGIVVCISGGSGGQSTAELTFALMLAVMRRIPQEHQAMRAGHWQTSQGVGLDGKSLGIIGLGRIGSRVAHIAQAFSMRVLATGFTLTPERAMAHGVRMAALEDLLARSDVVSIHLRFSERSDKLIGRPELRLMKPTAYLINTARGAIVDESALIEALRHRRIAGAGLDVFAQEPVDPGNPLLQLDNVVCTPHIGFVTQETYEQMLGGAVENIINYLDGHPTNVQNPQALTLRQAK